MSAKEVEAKTVWLERGPYQINLDALASHSVSVVLSQEECAPTLLSENILRFMELLSKNEITHQSETEIKTKELNYSLLATDPFTRCLILLLLKLGKAGHSVQDCIWYFYDLDFHAGEPSFRGFVVLKDKIIHEDFLVTQYGVTENYFREMEGQETDLIEYWFQMFYQTELGKRHLAKEKESEKGKKPETVDITNLKDLIHVQAGLGNSIGIHFQALERKLLWITIILAGLLLISLFQP